MAQVVEAGLIDKILNLFDKIGNAITRYGLSVEKKRSISNGGQELFLSLKDDNNKQIRVRAIPVKVKDEDGWFNLQFAKVENGVVSDIKETSKPVKHDAIEQYIQNMAWTYYGKSSSSPEDQAVDTNPKDIDYLTGKPVQDDAEDANSSYRINIRLSKVVASECDEVYLESVKANYEACSALSDLNSILDSSDFLSSLPEGTSFYQVTPEDSELSIEPCNEEACNVSIFEVLSDLIGCIYKLRDDIQYICWNIRGMEFESVCQMLGSIRWECESECDRLAQICYDTCGSVCRPLYQASDLGVSDGIDIQDALSYITLQMNGVVSSLELNKYNVDECYHPVIDEMIRYWKAQVSQIGRLYK